MNEKIKKLPDLAREKYAENAKYFQVLKKRTPKNLDILVHKIHDRVFDKTDCLACGNCCRTTSPLFTEKDIKRIAKHLKIKEVNYLFYFFK